MTDEKRFDLMIVDAGSRKIAVYTPQFEGIQKGDTVNFFFDGDAVSGTVLDIYEYKKYASEIWNALTITTGHEPVKCLSKTYTKSIDWPIDDEIVTEEEEGNEDDTV